MMLRSLPCVLMYELHAPECNLVVGADEVVGRDQKITPRNPLSINAPAESEEAAS